MPSSEFSSSQQQPSPTIVDTPESFQAMLAHLRRARLFALDTESDSLFRYYPRVCLIQITAETNGEGSELIDYIVDPIQGLEIDELGTLLSDPNIEAIIHSASNDISTMQRDWDFTFRNIFDTQLAARILGWKRVGLAAILQEQFDIKSDKRMQRTNWGKRPLTAEQIDYAQMDTHYLLELRRRQIKELQEHNRLEEAREAFALLAQTNYRERTPSQRTFWQIKGSRDMPRKQTNILQALWEWREKEAQHQNRPAFKIASDAVLLQIATRQPTSRKELHAIRGLSDNQVQRYGRAMLRAAREGRQNALPAYPTQKQRPEDLIEGEVAGRYEALRSWRTKVAEERGVDPDIIFTNETLLTIARQMPANSQALQNIPEIGSWKAETYANAILDILARRA